MRALQLGRHVTWRMVVRGLIGGAALGSLYGPLSILIWNLLPWFGFEVKGLASDASYLGGLAIIGIFVGAMDGGFTGLLVGLVDGLVLSAIMILLVRSLSDPLAFRQILGAVSAAIGGLGTFFLFMLTGGPIPSYQGTTRLNWFQIGATLDWFVWVVVLSLVAAGYGGWAGNRVAMQAMTDNPFMTDRSPGSQKESLL